jgi:hypothetical protein
MPNRATSQGHGYTDAKIDIIEEILLEGPNDLMCMQEQHMLYYPSEVRTYESLKHEFQELYNSKKPNGDPTCPAIVCLVKRAWDCIKEKMDFSDGEGVLNDTVSAGAGNGDDSVNEEEEGAEGSTNTIEEFNTEVTSGEQTILHATTSRSKMMGGGN